MVFLITIFNLIWLKSNPRSCCLYDITRCHINGSIEDLFFASQGFLMIRTTSHEHATVWIRNPWLAKMRGSGFRTAWPSIFLQDVWNATSNIILISSKMKFCNYCGLKVTVVNRFMQIQRKNTLWRGLIWFYNTSTSAIIFTDQTEFDQQTSFQLCSFFVLIYPLNPDYI